MHKPKESKATSVTSDSYADVPSMILRLQGGIPIIQEKIAKVQTLLSRALELQRAADVPEELNEIIEGGINTHRNTLSMMKELEAGLQNEIVRVREAELALETNDIESLKESFRSFIISDASLSNKTIMMNFYDFDEIIRSIEEFHNHFSTDDKS